MAEQQSHYEVLGVARDADARTIKRAYFEKVRQFPPETHPEEFKRLREAYEVLSDPSSRKVYDARDEGFSEHEPEIAEALRRAQDLEQKGEPGEAELVLRHLLKDHPEVHVARDMLALTLMSQDQAQRALEQLEVLVEEQPRVARYQLHLAFSLGRLGRHDQAVEALRRARDLDPEDPEIRVALADCLVELKQRDEALAELDYVIAKLGGGVETLGLRVRRVRIELTRGQWDRAAAEIDRLEQDLPADDREVRRYAATRLGSLAAELFADNRFIDANRLLTRCRKLNPESQVEVAYPFRFEVAVDELPAASRAWLEQESHDPMVRSPAWVRYGIPLLAFAGSVALTSLVADWALFSASKRDVGLLSVALRTLPLALAVAWSARWLLGSTTSKLGKFSTLHPFYLLEVVNDRLIARTLLWLTNVELIHHSTNGSYNFTEVRHTYGGSKFSINFNGQQEAESWANQLLARRQRVLELMDRGLLEAEEGIDFIPAALVEKAGTRRWFPGRWIGRLKWYGAAAVASVLLALVSVPVQRARAEEASRYNAADPGLGKTMASVARGEDPSGKSLERIKAAFEDARSTLARNTAADSEGRKVLEKALAALEAGKGRRVRLDYQTSETGARKAARAQALITRLQPILERAVGTEVLRLEGEDPGPTAFSRGEPTPLLLVVRERQLDDGGRYLDREGAELPAPRLEWDLCLRAAEGDCLHQPVSARLSPRPEVAALSQEAAQRAVDEASIDDFVERWRAGWGLPRSRERVIAPVNPYASAGRAE